MGRVEEISAANLRIVSKLNLLKTQIGDLGSLSTTNQSSLVSAINEVSGVAQSSSGGVSLNDAVTNLTQTWSSNKISSEITLAITTALEGEDLSDLADSIQALVAADNGLVSATSPQSFTDAERVQARTNIDAADATEVGDTSHDFVAEIDSNLAF